MQIETKHNVGDEVYWVSNNQGMQKLNVDEIKLRAWAEGKMGIYYDLGNRSHCVASGVEESKVLTKSEAIQRFQNDQTARFLDLFQ